jgi:hypothetical protein
MVKWTPQEHLTFDIAFALKKVTIPGFRKALTEEHRIAIAKTTLSISSSVSGSLRSLRSRCNEPDARLTRATDNARQARQIR